MTNIKPSLVRRKRMLAAASLVGLARAANPGGYELVCLNSILVELLTLT